MLYNNSVKWKSIFFMKIGNNQQFNRNIPFKGFTDLMMTNVFLNKGLFDLAGSDIPWVVMANNKEERRERLNRATLSIGLIFISPLVALPFVNRFAMRYISKLTPKMFSNEYNAIRLSNKYLKNEKQTKEGLEILAKQSFTSPFKKFYYNKIKKQPVPEEKINISTLLAKTDGSYEKLRKKILTAKSIVLGSDFLLVTGSFGHIGFFNNKQTEEKTGQIGYSAEIKMADKEIVEKRASKYKRDEKLRYKAFLVGLAGLAIGVPMIIRHGLISQKTSKFNNLIKKYGEKFDYNDAIFMKRLPLALSFLGMQLGCFMASRNNTERKDNVIRGTSTLSIFFLGDLLLTSILGKASDKLFGTKLIKNTNDKTFLNKILPPMKDLKELKTLNSPKSTRNAKIIFWTNFVFLSTLMGIITPYLINKIIKKDVNNDIKK